MGYPAQVEYELHEVLQTLDAQRHKERTCLEIIIFGRARECAAVGLGERQAQVNAHLHLRRIQGVRVN
eukprot:6146710-Pyramimonas_sp.AAC.1